VKIDNRTGGSVRVRASATDRVDVRVWRRGEGADVTIGRDAAGAVLVSSVRRGWGPATVRMTVLVPPGSPVWVEARGGAVDMTATGADAHVRTGGGSVRVVGSRGDVSAETGGGAVRLSDVDGSVLVRTGGGSIHVDGRLRGESSLSTGGGSVTIALRPGTNITVDGRGTAVATDIDGLEARRFRIEGIVGTGADGSLAIRTAGGAVRVVEA
jgi:hypothetical protein